MEALLKKQVKSLESLESIAKMDRLMQLVQTKEAVESEAEQEKIDEQLKEMNKTLKKGLTDKNGDSLNSNVIRLFDAIKKVAVAGRELNTQEVKDITGASQERRQYNTIKPRVENVKENVKDFFTVRGFLDKTGIAERNSGGLISEYLDRAEDKKKYIDNRMKLDPTANLHGEEKAREIFGKQFDKQQNVQFDISKNEKKLKEYKDQGFTEAQIARTPEAKRQKELATELAKVDTRVRPEGFDAKTGLIKEKPVKATDVAKSEKRAIGDKEGKVIPFPSKDNSLGAEETMLEQNRMVAEQSALLKKIEENTRALGGQKPGEPQPVAQKQEETSGGGLLDMLGNSKFGKIAKSAGRGLGRAAMGAGRFLVQRAGPVAALAAAAGGAYTAYSGYGEAGEKEAGALKGIDERVASGEISEAEAKSLRVEAREQGTVDRSSAVGKGTGQAVGGVAGALKGAAAGAAIGSVVPVVGTAIGGALGATLGAVGGSWLGGKGGEWVGEKFGKAKNWVGGLFGGKSGESDTPGVKTAEALKGSAAGISPTTKKDSWTSIAGERVYPGQDLSEKQMAVIGMAKSQGNTYSPEIEAQYAKQLKQPQAAGAPTSGDTISKASGENEASKLDATRGGGTANIVSAPTINNSQNVQNNAPKLPPRNTDNTVNRYLQKTYAF